MSQYNSPTATGKRRRRQEASDSDGDDHDGQSSTMGQPPRRMRYSYLPKTRAYNSRIIGARSMRNSHNVTKTNSSVDNRINNSINNKTENTVDNRTTIINHERIYQMISRDDEPRMADVLSWLSDLDFKPTQDEIYSKHESGTGDWFLKKMAFTNWLEGKYNILFCPGIPGAGKTVLTSIVINYLEKTFKEPKTAAVAYLYCNYKEQRQQTSTNLICSLLHQTVVAALSKSGSARDTVSEAILTFYKEHNGGEGRTRPSRIECIEILKEVVIPQFMKIFIVVDALDEIVSTELDSFVAEIKYLAELEGVALLVTSRTSIDISEHFKFREDAKVLEIVAKNSDVEAYLHGEIKKRTELMRLARKDTSLVGVIIKGITEKAKGMFLLARFHLQAVAAARCVNEIHSAIQDLPGEVEDTYDKVLERINPRNLDLAKGVLTWITYAYRTLKIKELQHALAVCDNDMKFDEGSIILEEVLISSCAGLVVLDHKSSTVKLVHYTAQVYLLGRGAQFLSTPHTKIAATCLRYLSLNLFDRYWLDYRNYSLLKYAAQNWGIHAREASTEPGGSSLSHKILTFLGQQKNIIEVLTVACYGEMSGFDYYRRRMTEPLLMKMDLDAQPLLLTALYGLHDLVNVQLTNGESPNITGETGETPLYLAAREGHNRVVELLLDHGADVNKNAPLSIAAHKGHKEVVWLLLERDADPDQNATHSELSPLYLASEKGHTEIVQLLLSKGANVNSPLSRKSLLSAAAGEGDEDLVWMLLRQGAIVNPESQTALLAYDASSTSQPDGSTKLPPSPAYNTTSWLRMPPLHCAIKGRHEHIVRLLLSQDADPNSVFHGRNALSIAVKRRDEAIVRMLLDEGTVVESTWWENTLRSGVIARPGLSPSCFRPRKGYEGIFRLLQRAMGRGGGSGIDSNTERSDSSLTSESSFTLSSYSSWYASTSDQSASPSFNRFMMWSDGYAASHRSSIFDSLSSTSGSVVWSVVSDGGLSSSSRSTLTADTSKQ